MSERARGDAHSGRFTPGMLLVAAAITLAPFVVQTTALVLSRSMSVTVAVAVVLALLFVAGGIAIQARLAGSLRAVSPGSIVGVVLAVAAYHAFALPIAYVVYVKVFASGS